MIKCVIFDADGILVDTESASKEAFEHYASLNNETLDTEFYMGIYGTNIAYATPQFNRFPFVWENLDEIYAHKQRLVDEKYKNNTILMPGLLEILAYLREENYTICIASSSSLDTINRYVKAIDFKFDHIVSGMDFEETKPHPQIYQTVARIAGFEVNECLVLEDSYLGLVAAKKAGMNTIFVEDQVEYNNEIQAVADYYTRDLFEAKDVIEAGLEL